MILDLTSDSVCCGQPYPTLRRTTSGLIFQSPPVRGRGLAERSAASSGTDATSVLVPQVTTTTELVKTVKTHSSETQLRWCF